MITAHRSLALCLFIAVSSIGSVLAQSGSDLVVYDDVLQSPWINSSWGAAITFGSSEQAQGGSRSIKVAASAWGAMSLHHGNWGSQGIDPASYQSLNLAVHGGTDGVTLSISLENDAGQSFPRLSLGSMVANQWTSLSIPMNQLNPNGQTIHRLSIQESAGFARTFYVDEIRLAGLPEPISPALASPADQDTGVSTSPLLAWNELEEAAFYGLQLSTDSSFSEFVINRNDINFTSLQATGFSFETVYYWRVHAWVGSAYTEWSEIRSFTTMPASQSSWTVQSSGTSARLWAADFIGPNTVLAVGEGGTILRSTDAGVTWASQTSGATAGLRALSFIDANTGWVVGSGGTILKTTDGGTTWMSQSGVSTNTNLVGVSFTDANTGKVVAQSTQLYGTTDGGSTWTYITNVAPSFAGALHFTDAMTGHVLGFTSGAGTGGGGVLRSTNGGSSWSPTAAGSRSGMSAMSFAGTSGMTVGTDENRPAGSPSYSYAVVWQTNNGGSSWFQRNFQSGQYRYGLTAVSVADAKNSAIVGGAGTVFVSRNGGSWQIQSTGTSASLRGVAMEGASAVIAVGDGGLILRSSTGAPSGPPSTPALVSPADGATEVSTSPTLVWGNSPGAEGYELWVYASDSSIFFQEADITDTSYFLDGLAFNSTYYWHVSASNSMGASEPVIPPWSFTTESGAPPPAKGWVAQSSGMNVALRSVSFTDADRGTAVGDSGIILRTTDGGNTWLKQPSGTDAHLYGVDFVDANTGTAVGYPNAILRTTDGGVTWSPQTGADDHRGVDFVNKDTGTIIGGAGLILRTTNGGTTWTTQSNITSTALFGVSFWDENLGIAVGLTGDHLGVRALVMHTADGGNAWASHNPASTGVLFAVSFVDATTAVAVGTGGALYRTSDAGNTWADLESRTSSNLNGISFTDDGVGTAVGIGGTIIRTTDGGLSWANQGSGTNAELLGVSLVDKDVGIAVGREGTILRTTTGGAPPEPPTQELIVYEESLESPWINASWGSSVNFNNTEQARSGSNSIKISPTGSWGALSLHHGSWGSVGLTDPDSYESLDFAVFSTDAASIYISFANDQSQSFPSQSRSVTAGSWISVSVPMSQLNPNGQTIHRLSIQKSTAGVWYVDDLKLVGGQASAATASITAVESMALPKEFGVSQNYPNPFNPTTTISYQLPVDAAVTINIYDVLGREVATLGNEGKRAGVHHVTFDAGHLASGVYIFRIAANGNDGRTFVETRRMLLLK